MSKRGEDKPKVLLIEDNQTYRDLLARRLGDKGYGVQVAGTGEEGVAKLAGVDVDVAVVDLALPGINGLQVLKTIQQKHADIEAIMLTGNGQTEDAIEAIKLGAYHYMEKPAKFAELCTYIDKAYDKRKLALGCKSLKEQLSRQQKIPKLIGTSSKIDVLRGLIRRVAPNPTPVLIEGETGTGKDVCARLIHAQSDRADGPFIPVNCGAFADNLLENELFGHARDAYTGAERDRAGLFEVAEGGTLFIDEVCEMDLDNQKKFLRVLENGEYRRIGETRVRYANVRIIAATNRKVKDEVAAGRFREDLYFRLNVLGLETPPLREHREDIPALVEFFLERNAGRFPHKTPRVAPEALSVFQRYPWPGNVRELNGLLERALVMSEDGLIELANCPGLGASARLPAIPAPAPVIEYLDGDDGPPTLEELERQHMVRVLELAEYNKTRAAKMLGISLRSLYRKIERHGVRAEKSE